MKTVEHIEQQPKEDIAICWGQEIEMNPDNWTWSWNYRHKTDALVGAFEQIQRVYDTFKWEFNPVENGWAIIASRPSIKSMISNRDASPVRSSANTCKARDCGKLLEFDHCDKEECKRSICLTCIRDVKRSLEHAENLFYEVQLPGENWKQRGFIYEGAINADEIVAAILMHQPHPDARFNDKVYLNHPSELRFRIKDNKKFVHKKSYGSWNQSQKQANPPVSFG